MHHETFFITSQASFDLCFFVFPAPIPPRAMATTHTRSTTHANATSSTSTPTGAHFLNNDDPSSPSYIPRMARTIPTSSTVHTIQFKKVGFPMTPRPDELWIVETNSNGVETWKPIETFLETLDLTHDPAIILHSANNLRLQHQVLPREAPTTSSSTSHYILPHPEHPDVHFTEPFSAVPDHTNILQACWGRSAHHHSQGSTASLYWPPWRTTPESTQTLSPTLPMIMEPHPLPSPTPAEHAQDLRFQDGRVVPFGEMDISDTSV